MIYFTAPLLENSLDHTYNYSSDHVLSGFPDESNTGISDGSNEQQLIYNDSVSDPIDALSEESIIGIDNANSFPQDKITNNREPIAYDYTSGVEGGFNIDLLFSGEGWTDEYRFQAISMAELISTLIVGDIKDTKYRGNFIDDINIELSLQTIDDEGRGKGWSQIIDSRGSSHMPSKGLIAIDSADVNTMAEKELLDDVFLHEMIHAIGFHSANKNAYSLVDDSNIYTGLHGQKAYQEGIAQGVYSEEFDLLINPDNGMHWEQNNLALPRNEIMTRTLDSTNLLSKTTLGVLEDLGYETMFEDNAFANTANILDVITANWTINEGLA